MSLSNQLFLLLLNYFFFGIISMVKGEEIKTENDCSEFETKIEELLLKIKDLEDKNKELELENEELREWKRKEEERRKEEEKEEEEEETEEETDKIDQIYNSLNSILIENKEEFKLLYKRLKKNGELTDFKLLYRGSEDGKSSKDFHRKCDGIAKTISIIKSNKGYKFGGYAENKWTINAFSWVNNDFNSFVFSLNLMEIYNSTTTYNEKYHLGEYSGPQFWAFTVADDTGYSLSDLKPFGYVIQGIYHDGNKHFSGFPTKYEINGGKSYYYVDEIEVFQIIYKD